MDKDNEGSLNQDFIQLLTELTVRVSALEQVLISKKLIQEQDLANSLLNTMVKLKEKLGNVVPVSD